MEVTVAKTSHASEGGDVSVWSTTSRVWSHDSSCTATLVPHWVCVSLWVWGVWYGLRNGNINIHMGRLHFRCCSISVRGIYRGMVNL